MITEGQIFTSEKQLRRKLLREKLDFRIRIQEKIDGGSVVYFFQQPEGIEIPLKIAFPIDCHNGNTTTHEGHAIRMDQDW